MISGVTAELIEIAFRFPAGSDNGLAFRKFARLNHYCKSIFIDSERLYRRSMGWRGRATPLQHSIASSSNPKPFRPIITPTAELFRGIFLVPCR